MKTVTIQAMDGMGAAKTYARINQIADADWKKLEDTRIVIRCELQGHVQNLEAKAQHWGHVECQRKVLE